MGGLWARWSLARHAWGAGLAIPSIIFAFEGFEMVYSSDIEKAIISPFSYVF